MAKCAHRQPQTIHTDTPDPPVFAAAHRPRHDHWQASDGLLLDDWGGDCSVFCPVTGETHLLSSLPAAALQELSRAALTSGELAASLALSCEIAPCGAWLEKIAGILGQLAGHELIERRSAAGSTPANG